jgi:lipopolysaccharide transport system ATP-binding protein
MTKKEIQTKFDEIVEFSGCDLYIDTPTKRYSSGMKVRLGFAVAVFLDPEILVVDEVLAVGDAEFQQRAINKMLEISKRDNKTILFVSHNLESVSSLCDTSIVLENGTLVYQGGANDGINHYIKKSNHSKEISFPVRGDSLEIVDAKLNSNNLANSFSWEDPIELIVTIKKTDFLLQNVRINLRILNSKQEIITKTDYIAKLSELQEITKTIHIPNKIFYKGLYDIVISIDYNGHLYIKETTITKFVITSDYPYKKGWGIIKPDIVWR